jgi:hypothetical protein
MKKIMTDPLIHFSLLGLLIYFVYLGVATPKHNANYILVSEGKIKQLSIMYKKIWQRSPSPDELNNLIQAHVREQVAYHEGLALGLDKNDIVIIRRVQQKLDFIAEESIKRPPASDSVLTDYLNRNPEGFIKETRYTLRHIFFDKTQHSDQAHSKAKTLHTSLTKNPNKNIGKMGERYVFKPYYTSKTTSDFSRIFGKKFSDKLAHLSPNIWQPPLDSEFGSHLIYIEHIEHAPTPKLSEIRADVIREWEHSLRKKSSDDFYQKLLAKYDITINWPTNSKIVN